VLRFLRRDPLSYADTTEQAVHAEIGVHAAEEADELLEQEDDFYEAFGKDAEPSPDEVAAAKAKADELAARHGPGYHGFGNPPDPPDDPPHE
jgi:hypothetical protein